MLQILFYLTIALHVSDIIITHLQEHKIIVTTASGNRYTVLLSVAIVEDLELICWWRTPFTTHSNQFQLFHDNNRQQCSSNQGRWARPGITLSLTSLQLRPLALP
jgi:hypothetical protein